jgi:hypothetical protein
MTVLKLHGRCAVCNYEGEVQVEREKWIEADPGVPEVYCPMCDYDMSEAIDFESHCTEDTLVSVEYPTPTSQQSISSEEEEDLDMVPTDVCSDESSESENAGGDADHETDGEDKEEEEQEGEEEVILPIAESD